MKLTETTQQDLDAMIDQMAASLEHLNIHQIIYVIDTLRSRMERAKLGRKPVDLLQVSEDVKVVLNGQTYLLEKGDKIAIL